LALDLIPDFVAAFAPPFLDIATGEDRRVASSVAPRRAAFLPAPEARGERGGREDLAMTLLDLVV
jgi:hypothetical protein